MNIPETRYARSGEVNIAYQVIGDGPFDLVFVPGFVSNIELGWGLQGRADFLRGLASFARLIQLDKRGTGMSDRVRELPTLETRMDDVRAVMDAAGSERAALFGVDSGGPMSILFATTHPERTWGLVLYGTFARVLWSPDHPFGPTEDDFVRTIESDERRWGSLEHGVDVMNLYSPSLCEGGDDVARDWAAYFRQSASPGAFAAFQRMNMQIDVRDLLPSVYVPTLVTHRTGDRVVDIRAGRYLAEHIAGAQFAELEGEDHTPFTGDCRGLVDAARNFLTATWAERAWEAAHQNRVLATVLFTDIVDSTAKAVELGDARWQSVLVEHDALVRRQLVRFRGREIDKAGDGFLAQFDGPARAIECARAIAEGVRRLGLEIRAGLHTGEVEVSNGSVQGVAVHMGSRVAGLAEPGEVLVSGTVKDLVAGSGLEFDERGTAELKGIPGEWRLYALRNQG